MISRHINFKSIFQRIIETIKYDILLPFAPYSRSHSIVEISLERFFLFIDERITTR